jgi:hypothetical protein
MVENENGEPGRRLLETYSNIPSDEVEKHVYTIVGFLSPQIREEKLTQVCSEMRHGKSGHIHVLASFAFSICR